MMYFTTHMRYVFFKLVNTYLCLVTYYSTVAVTV